MNVEDALCIVLKKTSHPVGTEDLFLSPDLVGRIVAKAVRANDAFPPFPASIMDGYAVCAPIEPGTYRVVEEIFAGQASQHRSLLPGEVVYITTGAMVPSGATGVVKVEETEKADESHVKINVMVDVGVNIREVGSDIAAGEVIVEVGHILTPTDLGLLATIGCITVTCYKKPVIGVLSTGDELVDYCETALGGSQIRDSNRLTLVSTLRADGYIVRDYGIGGDSFEVLKALLMKMSEECDVVVSSGGVSMGAADHVKPILGEIGTIHFQKLNLKPGKPTVFASLNHSNATTGDSKTVYFFGLPGNPVSCLVTKELFITPALKRLQGLTADQCLHPQVLVEVQGGSIALDAERVEYHRVSIAYGTGRGHLIARSTGNQRSSRLLSMQQAHGLLVLPQGPGMVHAGSILPALLLSPLHTLPPPALSVHPLAASLDQPASSSAPSQSCLLSTVSNVNTDWKVIRTGILTISDRASQGVYSDESGPEIVKLLKKMNEEEGFPLTMTVVQTKIVPDEPGIVLSGGCLIFCLLLSLIDRIYSRSSRGMDQS